MRLVLIRKRQDRELELKVYDAKRCIATYESDIPVTREEIEQIRLAPETPMENPHEPDQA